MQAEVSIDTLLRTCRTERSATVEMVQRLRKALIAIFEGHRLRGETADEELHKAGCKYDRTLDGDVVIKHWSGAETEWMQRSKVLANEWQLEKRVSKLEAALARNQAALDDNKQAVDKILANAHECERLLGDVQGVGVSVLSFLQPKVTNKLLKAFIHARVCTTAKLRGAAFSKMAKGNASNYEQKAYLRTRFGTCR